MSIVLITGDHPRHKFFVNEMLETGLMRKDWNIFQIDIQNQMCSFMKIL